MQIKIYTKTHSPLTTLIQTRTESDFNALTYKETLHQVGDCSFSMRLDGSKANLVNLKQFNIVEVCEDNGTVKWSGVIIYRRVLLNVVNITCFSIAHLLTKRITPANNAQVGTAGAVVTNLLATTNAVLDTQITAGVLTDPANVNLTFNRSSVFDALKTVSEASGGQFRINPDRTLDFKTSIGSDLSSSVIFQYNIDLIAAANILTFQVEDDAKSITTKTYGESGALTTTQTNTPLYDEYGLFEEYKNYRELGNQGTLDSTALENNRGSELSPLLNLSPDVIDNFEVGDLVKVIIKNKLININSVYQVTEKSVKIKGGNERQITIRVNSNNSDFFKQIKDLKRSVDLLIRTV